MLSHIYARFAENLNQMLEKHKSRGTQAPN